MPALKVRPAFAFAFEQDYFARRQAAKADWTVTIYLISRAYSVNHVIYIFCHHF